MSTKSLRALVRAFALIGGLALITGPVSAGPGHPPHPKGPGHPPGHHAKGPKKPHKPRTPAERKARVEKHKKWAKARRANREQWRMQRKTRVKALRHRLHRILKGKPIRPAVRNELKAHYRRTAHLNRLKEVAAEKENDEAIERIDTLLQKEQARHDAFLAKQGQEESP